jgi:hypothetical protein
MTEIKDATNVVSTTVIVDTIEQKIASWVEKGWAVLTDEYNLMITQDGIRAMEDGHAFT